jgi:hypothetical protein
MDKKVSSITLDFDSFCDTNDTAITYARPS